MSDENCLKLCLMDVMHYFNRFALTTYMYNKNLTECFFKEYLEKLENASELLFENNAHYPRKISHKNPQNLAIEALEVYYRIHASILKYLEQHEGKPIKRSLAVILEQTLKNCTQSPFMTYDSTLRDKSKEHIASEGSLSANQEICKTKENATYTPESRQAVLVKSVIDNRKIDCRKRYSNDAILMNDAKKIKLSSVSHLQLMQDVVALIDELITKVCDKVSCKQSNFKWKDSKPNFEPNNSYLNTNAEMVDRNSHIMDNLWKEKIVFVQAKDKLTSIQDGIRKSEGHWMQNEDIQMENLHKLDKSEERKRICKLDGVPSRRASQESTTTTQTTTTETNNSTSSSSDESSSSDDSSDSSSSSDSDSESGQSEIEKKKTINLYEDAYLTEEETNKLIQYCLAGLEQCVLRFPEHYKSIYRLAYFFFNNKTAKNILKCKKLLLETYECQFHSNQTIQGLFSERKNTNFFNGIWRIPIQEIDRPGSFASHMSRCVLLLMQVLKEIGDSRILTELCIQLRKTPDTEKKYLRDTEREQLSHQALTLCLQCLRNKIKTANVLKLSTDTYQNSIDEQIQVLLDIYNTYQHIKNIQEYENLEIPKLQKLLEDAYTASVANPNVQGNIFELAKEYCRQKIREKKFGCASIDSNVSMKSINTNPFPTNINMDLSSSNIPLTTLSRKSQKIVSGRPRGRPPGIHKFSQVTNNDSVLNQNRYSMQHSSASNTYTVNTNNRSSNPYCLNPFFESNVLAAILGSGYNSNMIDSAVGYFNQVTAYPNALQQYQNTLNTISNINVSNTKKSSDSLSNIEATHNMTMTSSNLSIAKDKPDISITPVTGYVPQIKSKSVKTVSTSNLHSDHAAMTSQFSKSVKILSTPQYSLPKPSVQQQRLPQTALEVQVPFTSISSPLKDSKSTHYTTIPQTTKTIITSMNETSCTAQSGISLQHKLLSKKQDQRPRYLTTTANSMKKQKYNKTDIHSNYINLLNNLSNPYVSSNLNAIPVSTTPSLSGKSTKLLSSEQKSIINVKTPDIKVSASNLQSDSNVNTLSVLSQLQQHSHLEIIPQSSLARKNIDLIHVPKKSMGIQNLRESVNLSNTSSLSVYELPRRKLSTNFSSTAQGKKQDKVEKNTVEIITLDD